MIAQESSSEVSDEDKDEGDSGDEDEDEDDILGSDNNRPATHHQGSSRKEKDLMKDAREIFRWTSRQKELVEALWQMLDSDANNDNAQREA